MSRFFAASLAALSLAGAPAVVDVRIEGASRTLFEGPVRTDGHDIRASSDTQARRCDGTNLGANPSPGPSATAATVDALALTGRDFDGQWYPGYDDYFIQRLGPDAEDGGAFAYWGIVVNRAFTPTGGCQYRVTEGDDVLWVWDAFNGRPFLWLSATASSVAVGEPFSVLVESDGPVEGVKVAPVSTDAAGDQTVLAADAAAVTAGADGRATLTFATPGWHRVKADAPGRVRSNRLDVCVGACGPAPADTLVRDPLATPTPTPTPTATPSPEPTATPSPEPVATVAPQGAPGPVRLEAPRVVPAQRSGRVEVRWRVLDAGPGVRGWAIESAPAGTARWTLRASGTGGEAAAPALPAGRSYDLRLTVTDVLGRAVTAGAGRVVVPLDDRAVLGRGWSRAADEGAWRGTISRGARGATASVKLAAGRPVVLVRGAAKGTRVEFGGRVMRVSASTRSLGGSKRARAGRVKLRVLSGRVAVDGFAVAP